MLYIYLFTISRVVELKKITLFLILLFLVVSTVEARVETESPGDILFRTTTTVAGCSRIYISDTLSVCSGSCPVGKSCVLRDGGCHCFAPTTTTLKTFSPVTVPLNLVTTTTTLKTYQPPDTSLFLADSDGDGIQDYKDDCPDLPDGPKLGQCNGYGGIINCTSDSSCWYQKCRLSQSDYDKDGLGDACDNCPFNANGGELGTCVGDLAKYGKTCEVDSDCGMGRCSLNQEDSDGDGTADACDNCPYKININQKDTDTDGVGDSCDDCPSRANGPTQGSCNSGLIQGACKSSADCLGGPCYMAQEDADNDGFGDVCDKCPGKKDTGADLDGDWVDGGCDNCPAVYNKDQKDGDNDGVGDACDCGDGIQGPNEEGIDCGGTYQSFGTHDTCAACDFCDNSKPLPGKFDWRSHNGKNWMTVVKDQGMCGSCWAYSAVGIVEAKYNIEQGYNKDVNLGEQYLVSGCAENNPGDCLGGYKDVALITFRDIGVGSEKCYPYQSGNCVHGEGADNHLVCNAECNSYVCGKPGTCSPACQGWHTGWRISSITQVAGTIDSVKRAVACHGPLSVSSHNWWHAVVLTGWDDNYKFNSTAAPKGVWIIKNSWGANHNGDGYDHVPYYGDIHSDILNDPIYYVDGVASYGTDP